MCPLVFARVIKILASMRKASFLWVKIKAYERKFFLQVPSYSVVKKRVDLMTIQSLMNNDGYIWEKFIEDMALIVNNAVVAFEVSF